MLSLITRQANPPTPPPPGQASLLREIVGNPFRDFRPTRVGRTLDNWWSDPTVLRLARAIYDERRFDELAVLADALEDAGCADAVILAHLRGKERCQRCAGHGWYHDGPRGGQRSIQHCGDCDGTGWIALRGPHVRGCWAPDLVLGKA